MKKNSYSHFILYSKGWYQRNHPYIDMQILIGHWSGIDPIYVDDRNIFSVLTTMIYPCIKFERHFNHLLGAMIKRPYDDETCANNMNRFIKACMDILSGLSIDDIDGEMMEVDYVNVLPRRKD